jgi:hypothetical protein
MHIKTLENHFFLIDLEKYIVNYNLYRQCSISDPNVFISLVDSFSSIYNYKNPFKEHVFIYFSNEQIIIDLNHTTFSDDRFSHSDDLKLLILDNKFILRDTLIFFENKIFDEQRVLQLLDGLIDSYTIDFLSENKNYHIYNNWNNLILSYDSISNSYNNNKMENLDYIQEKYILGLKMSLDKSLKNYKISEFRKVLLIPQFSPLPPPH